MIEDNEGLELELISFFPCLYRLAPSFMRVVILACLARFAQRTKKRETARSREQGIGGNAQPCKTGSYRSYPSWREGGWLLSLSYVNERSAVGKISTVLAFKSLSSVKRLIEKCIVYIYGRFIVTRF